MIPCYNEETQIGMVLEGIPDFVDRIVVVDDCSNDSTLKIIQEFASKEPPRSLNPKEIQPDTIYDHAKIALRKQQTLEETLYCKHKIIGESIDRVVLIQHEANNGVGAAIATGYKWCRDHEIDCTAVMAGDGQMDPTELESICKPVIEQGIDYVKGNRLIHRSAWLVIPKLRFFGNSILSILTKIASGYWHVSDTQTGYTAISLTALRSIRIYDIYRSYGMPNDMLVKLNISFCTIKEVEIKPVYNIGEQSKMRIVKVIPRVSILLFKSFFKRLWIKYLFRDFHPLFLLYNTAFLLLLFSLFYFTKIVRIWSAGNTVNELTAIAFFFLFISGFQSLLFAMWMDIQDNERLYK